MAILVAHIKKPGVSREHPEKLISYGEALKQLKLPTNAPRGETDGKTLQLNGLNDLARWVNQHPKKLPRITGVIISRSGHDGPDGFRRPPNVPSAGYFKEYKRHFEDWDWWLKEVEKSIAFDWSPYIPRSSTVESFTPEEITGAGTFHEGSQSEVTSKIRERSAHLRELAREYFAKQSHDGRLHCAVCNWAPPLTLKLTGPIVEIHHGLGISKYPLDGRSLTLKEAIQYLTPLCPNCHRVTHAKLGGGVFTLDEVKQGMISSTSNVTA